MQIMDHGYTVLAHVCGGICSRELEFLSGVKLFLGPIKLILLMETSSECDMYSASSI